MKGADHEAITDKAIKIFNDLFPSEKATKLAVNRKAIAAASKDEDTSPIFTRLANWHFYKANDKLEPKRYSAGDLHTPIKIHPTSDEIYGYWVKQLINAKKTGDDVEFCDKLGRVLHHVQDMSTPSHVVPVYHGLSVKDSYEECLHDRINALLAEITLSASEIETLKASAVADFNSIYVDAAMNTLGLLARQFPLTCNGIDEQKNWSLFWQSFKAAPATTNVHDEKYGFGSYGPLGDDFGKSDQFARQGTTYQIGQEVYNGLLTNLLKKNLIESIEVLRTSCA